VKRAERFFSVGLVAFAALATISFAGARISGNSTVTTSVSKTATDLRLPGAVVVARQPSLNEILDLILGDRSFAGSRVASTTEEDRIAAIQHAREAIVLGSDDATVLAAAAHIIALDEHDSVEALKLFDRALELSNSNIFALSLSAVILAWMGKAELAIQRAEGALRLNPFDLYNFRVHHALAIVYFCREQYGDALSAARSAVHANPKFSTAHAVLAAALWRVGHAIEAKEAARTVLRHERAFFNSGGSTRLRRARAGGVQTLRRRLARDRIARITDMQRHLADRQSIAKPHVGCGSRGVIFSPLPDSRRRRL